MALMQFTEELVFTMVIWSTLGIQILETSLEPPKMECTKGSGTWYGYEFIMMAGAEVVDTSGNIIHIISENYTNASSFDISPDQSHTYGWEPLPGYFNTGSDNQDEYPAMSHKPETWPIPPHDYPGLPGTRDGLWNGEFGAYKRADQESYYVWMIDIMMNLAITLLLIVRLIQQVSIRT